MKNSPKKQETIVYTKSLTLPSMQRVLNRLDNSKMKKMFYIFTLGFLVRLTCAVFYNREAASAFGDSPDYVSLAYSIREGQFALNGVSTTFKPPLYPLFLASIPDNLWLPIQFFLGATTCVLLFLITKESLPSILYCFAPLSVYLSVAILSETLIISLLTLSIYLWTKGRVLIAGTLMGLAALIKPMVFPLLLFGLVLTLIPNLRRHFKKLLIISALTFAVSLPWMVRNTIIDGRITLTQGSGGLGVNFLYGTFTHEEFGSTIWDEALKRYPIASNIKVDYTSEAIKRIKERPSKWLLARMEQYPRLFIDTGDYLTSNYFLRLLLVLIQIGIGLIALIGLRDQPFQLWLVPLFLTLFHLLLWTEPRYFLPAIPMILCWVPRGWTRLFTRLAGCFRSSAKV